MIFAAIMTVATVLIFGACGADPMEGVSERRSSYFTADDGAFAVTAVSGVREQPFALDGKVGELKPYTLVTAVPTEFDVDAIYTYTAVTTAGEYGGALVVHPFAASFSAEFDSETSDAFKVTITDAKGEKHEYEMVAQTAADMMTYDSAIEAAENALEPTGVYEIRVRVIKNPIGGEGMCWHVDFCFDTGKECSVLLDAHSAKVLAKKPA